MKTFEQRFAPGDPNRTFAAFKTTVLAFDRLTPRATTGTSGYSAATITTPPPDTDARLRALEAIAGIHCAAADFGDRLKALERVAAATAPVVSTQSRPLKYCHSHGINFSHDSKDCKRPRNGHRRGATMQNKLGGSLESVI